jgi:hypothetical protein
MTAALWAVVFLFIALTLPPARREAQGFDGGHVRRGAFHVHTVASDGGGTREDVARAAANAGLDFVILTDHGDGTREPAPPEYLHGVLIIDGVEVTTSAGHYAAFGAARAPYPLGGPPSAVIEDITRLGGFGVAAHPDSTKADLRWRDWNARADGLEWINGDSAWRDESAMTLARGIVDYLFRPGPTLAGLVERPSAMLRRLDEIARARHVVALAGADAHARLPLTSDEEPYGGAWTVPVPSYTQSFRAFVNLVETGQPMTGGAEQDAAALLAAIRAGRVAFAMTSLASPAQLSFAAMTRAGDTDLAHSMGSRLPAAQPVTFSARTSDVLKSGKSLVRLTLLRDGRVVTSVDGPQLSHQVEDARGVWRIEANLAHRPDIPWLLGNPIVIADDGAAAPREPGPAPEASLDLAGGAWAVEKQERSDGMVEEAGGGQRFSYQLAGGPHASQFVAAARPTGNTDAWDTVVLTARADSPTRLWVQLRLSDSGTGQRWGRSIYLDETSRTYRLPIREFGALEPRASASRPNVVQVRAVLMVVDTVNNRPGRAGRIHIDQLRLERQP